MNKPLPSSAGVALLHTAIYDTGGLKRDIDKLLRSISFKVPAGARVLVKPNYVASTNARISCTNPYFIRAVCELFIDHGAKPVIGDSPGFGTAQKVAEATGLPEAMKGLDVPVIEFNSGPKLELSFGSSVRLAAEAAETDLIVNLPKFKAHVQMRITAAVKNFFGCVVGARKAINHYRHGDVSNHFDSLITEIMLALQPSVTIIDAIETMSRAGPTNGDLVKLDFIGAAQNPVAMDTALLSMLKLHPHDVPLWNEAVNRNLPGARLDDVSFPLAHFNEIDTEKFVFPTALVPQAFKPSRIAIGAIKRLWRKIA